MKCYGKQSILQRQERRLALGVFSCYWARISAVLMLMPHVIFLVSTFLYTLGYVRFVDTMERRVGKNDDET